MEGSDFHLLKLQGTVLDSVGGFWAQGLWLGFRVLSLNRLGLRGLGISGFRRFRV